MKYFCWYTFFVDYLILMRKIPNPTESSDYIKPTRAIFATIRVCVPLSSVWCQLTRTQQPAEWSGTLRLFLLTGLQLEARLARTLICSARGSWWKAEEPCVIDPIDWCLTFKEKPSSPPPSPASLHCLPSLFSALLKPVNLRLNNIIVHFILTVTPARRGGRSRGLIESLKRAASPLKTDCAHMCAGVAAFDCFPFFSNK